MYISNKVIKTLLSLIICFSLIISSPFSVYSSADTQSEIDELKEEREEIRKKIEEQQALIDELSQEQADIIEQKAAIDQKNEYTLEQIKIKEQEIKVYDDIIKVKAEEVAEAQRAEDTQLQLYRSRVRAMEESGSYNILALFIRSANLSELLAAIDDIGEIMQNDRAVEDAYILARQKTERIKQEYEDQAAVIANEKAELQEEQRQLEADLEEANKLILQYTESIEENQDVLEEFEIAESEADAQINKLIAKLETERRKAAAASASAGTVTASVSGGSVKGSGSYGWPCSCTYITSCVGNRYHPVTGVWKYHSGMDIGASYGDTVWASDSGTVSLAGQNGGYGNCVMIDHGNGYYTLYGHLSSIAVSTGQSVSKGQTVGYVGSTGVSTGPHLHFEIRKGSSAIDFSGWFSGLTYAPDSGG